MSVAEPHGEWQAAALGADDNVAIVLEAVAAGTDVVVRLDDSLTSVTALEPIALGHKIALADVRPGDALIKYGECIGEASAAIARGAWVHVHNLRSRRARADRGLARAASQVAGERNESVAGAPRCAPGIAFDAHAYLDAAAAALDLPIAPASRDAVVANLARLHELAREVLAFDIPAHDSDGVRGGTTKRTPTSSRRAARR